MRRFSPTLISLALASSVLVACGSGTDGLDSITADVPESISPSVDRAVIDPNAPTQEWVAGVNQAGWDFHRTLEGNAVSSPLSIGAAFSLLQAAATGPTTESLNSIFAFPTEDEPGNGPDATHQAANAVLSRLTTKNGGAASNTDDTTIEIANQLFTRIDPMQSFVDTAAAHYGAAMVPLAEDNAKAVDEVNEWTNEQTHGLVPKIIGPADVTKDTSLIIVNTVYLNAKWQRPFHPGLTRESDFHLDLTNVVHTDFMSFYEPQNLRYIEHPNYLAIELPYRNGDLAMWIIIPLEIDGLEAVEAGLDAETIAGFKTNASEGAVSLTLPKWEYSLPPTDLLDTWLCPLGLCPRDPLHNISPRTDLQFALHGAKIIVDEEGTEAGAATAIGAEDSSAPEIDLFVNVDHPFTYTIIHKPTGEGQSLLDLAKCVIAQNPHGVVEVDDLVPIVN